MGQNYRETLRKEAEENLTGNILPYWMNRMVDPRGGFHGRRDGRDALHPEAEKGAVLNSRILWTFSAAYRVLGKPEYLTMATRAKREIIDRFHDKEYGGVYWSLDSAGKPLDTKKQFYALGFAVYGLSEYARATGDREALEFAVRLFQDIESHSRDFTHGGYIEATTREWGRISDMRLSEKDLNAAKSMNTHLHILEPYTNLLRVCEGAEVKEATRNLIRIFLDRIILPEKRGHMGLFFDEEWHPCDGGCISYGHDIEASWLLLEAAHALGEKELTERVVKAAGLTAAAAFEGRCSDGSMVYERQGDGRYDNDKHWWVQAENVIGQLYLYLYHGQTDMLEKAYQSWRYIRDHLVAPEGEWYWSVRDGKANKDEDKAGFWKCPYHNTRMCLEIIEHL